MPSLVSRTLLVGVLFWTAQAGPCQDLPRPDTAPTDAPRVTDPGWHALVGARVITAPGEVLETATVVIRNGKIVSVERGTAAPQGARRHEMAGLTIHAAFVESYLPVDAPSPDADAPGTYWNDGVVPQRSVLDGAGIDNGLAKRLRAAGFASAAAYPSDGLLRGTGAVLGLEEVEDGHRRTLLRDRTFTAIAFDRGRSGYPRSLMGSVALVRQVFWDWAADHARGDDRSSPGTALGALSVSPPVLFRTRDEVDALRAFRVLQEVGRSEGAVLVGTGTEYRRLEAVAALGVPLVLPIDYPQAPDVGTVGGAEAVTLRQLREWEVAPANAKLLADAGVDFVFTSESLDDRKDLLTNVAHAIARGLDPDRALAALTTGPAALLGVGNHVGRVAPGYRADLCVIEGDPLAADRTLREVWVGGARDVLEARPPAALDGAWTATFSHAGLRVDTITFEGDRKATLARGEDSVKAAHVNRNDRQLHVRFDAEELGGEGQWRLTALVQGDRLAGIGVAADGSSFAWTARRDAKPATEDAAAADVDEPATEAEEAAPAILTAADLAVPFGAYGRKGLPAQRTVLITGATIWTSGPAGRIDDGVLVVHDGKIVHAGRAADSPGVPTKTGVLQIDGRGLHVTPGLIDAHSHTGISGGVNEGTQSVTAEVRIGDVLDPDDISFYRQLAGGVTAVNQLHGSANPIGGQNSVVKLRWGVRDPEAMKFVGAPPGIKFALGENVKRSRSDDNTRYPNTRMGVETLIRDRFQAAKEYAALRAREPGTRRDLELEALAEILAGERLVHCHSYRQDEILMLCRVAEDFGFTIGTFQHGLECYKVAESVKRFARGASIFSDWWAYKYEVVDAIPENASILQKVGVVVSLNSDSDELARRLNTEAAKAVKYGGVAPVEALKMVTINPAIQLGIDDRVGSLEPGKDADFAIWSGDPLSSFSHCVATWIDGRCYWSRDEDAAAREHVAAERARLIQLALTAPGGRAGIPAAMRDSFQPGDCGCSELENMAREALQQEGVR